MAHLLVHSALKEFEIKGGEEKIFCSFETFTHALLKAFKMQRVLCKGNYQFMADLLVLLV